MMFGNSFTFRRLALLSALAFGLIAAPQVSLAQQAYIVGSPSNFDAANNEGQDANGFEIQIEGIQPQELGPSWPGNKYGAPEVVPYATGVYVRYKSAWDSFMQLFTATTVPKTPGVPFAGTCYQWNTAYLNAGCDHFGVRPLYTATGYTIVGYRWLFADPANPGQLVPSPNNIFVPTPVYSWAPPAVVGAPPVLVAEVQTPPPPPPPPPAALPQFGDATWMKVYKTEMTREVALDELTSDNPIVPQDITQIETDWVLMQPAPPPDGNHRQRNRQVNQGGVNSGTRSVIRRYETYAYTGAYDPATHEAQCADGGLCNSPQPGELGDMINAQMAAANVAVPGVSVTIAGTGKVESADKVISCGSKCSSANSLGAVVTLTATPASNNTFSGWTGACTGTATTCAITVSDAMATTATFAPKPATGGGGGTSTQFTLSVGLSNPGAVSATPAGIDRVLDCGSACSAKFNHGAVVTLTATPPAGKTFANWGGACSGADLTCTLTIGGDTSVKANFNK